MLLKTHFLMGPSVRDVDGLANPLFFGERLGCARAWTVLSVASALSLAAESSSAYLLMLSSSPSFRFRYRCPPALSPAPRTVGVIARIARLCVCPQSIGLATKRRSEWFWVTLTETGWCRLRDRIVKDALLVPQLSPTEALCSAPPAWYCSGAPRLLQRCFRCLGKNGCKHVVVDPAGNEMIFSVPVLVLVLAPVPLP